MQNGTCMIGTKHVKITIQTTNWEYREIPFMRMSSKSVTQVICLD